MTLGYKWITQSWTENPQAMIKESKKLDKYLDLARELKILWNMKVTVIPIIVVTLRIIPKNMEKKSKEDQRSTQILKRVLKNEKTCCNTEFHERPSVTTYVKTHSE